MKRTHYYKIMNRVSIVMGVIGFMFIAWMALSVLDVAVNTETHSNIKQCNMFALCEQKQVR
jgi:hypothetical protein